MGRIRSIKPTVFSSRTVAGWPIDVRWTFVGLWTYVDDDGPGGDAPRRIKAEVRPRHDRITPAKVIRHMQRIVIDGPLCRYDVDGKRYLHIVHWHEHQRINRPRRSTLPPCPVHEKETQHDEADRETA